MRSLGVIGLKWSDIPEGTKSSIESALINCSNQMDQRDMERLLKASGLLAYRFHERKNVASALFSVFRTLFSQVEPLQPGSQRSFPICIYNMTNAGVKLTVLPEDMKLAIFRNIEHRSPSAFKGPEISKLFYG
jgi:hypothetical protein